MNRIYVAGAYKGDIEENVRKACEAGIELLNAGYEPFVPHLAFHLNKISKFAEKRWKRWGLNWLPVCDGMVVISHSSGVEREIKKAKELNIPIFTLEELTVSTGELLAKLLDNCADENLFHKDCDCWRCPVERKCVELWDNLVERTYEKPKLRRRYLDKARTKLKEVFDEKHQIAESVS